MPQLTLRLKGHPWNFSEWIPACESLKFGTGTWDVVSRVESTDSNGIMELSIWLCAIDLPEEAGRTPVGLRVACHFPETLVRASCPSNSVYHTWRSVGEAVLSSSIQIQGQDSVLITIDLLPAQMQSFHVAVNGGPFSQVLIPDVCILRAERAFQLFKFAVDALETALEQKKLSMKPRDQNRVAINVGGSRFETTRDTILQFPDSMLALMLSDPLVQGLHSPSTSEVFIDANPEQFPKILDYYRYGRIEAPRHESDRAVLISLANFLGLVDLVDILSRTRES